MGAANKISQFKVKLVAESVARWVVLSIASKEKFIVKHVDIKQLSWMVNPKQTIYMKELPNFEEDKTKLAFLLKKKSMRAQASSKILEWCN